MQSLLCRGARLERCCATPKHATTSRTMIRYADGASNFNRKSFSGGPEKKRSKICCLWLEARLLGDCSGGNSRPLRPSGVGGGHFLIKKSGYQI